MSRGPPTLIGRNPPASPLVDVLNSSFLIGSPQLLPLSPQELRGISRLPAGKGGVFLQDMASDWLIAEMLDHRVGGTQKFRNLPHKMAAKVEAVEKGALRRQTHDLGPETSFGRSGL